MYVSVLVILDICPALNHMHSLSQAALEQDLLSGSEEPGYVESRSRPRLEPRKAQGSAESTAQILSPSTANCVPF